MKKEDVVSLIRSVPDFPKKGILFRDITPLLANPEAFKSIIDEFVVLCKNKGITKIVALESRGFIFGAPLAYALGVGFVPIRKRGKLPYKKLSIEFDLEYGKDIIEIHQDALDKNDRVLLVDDESDNNNINYEILKEFGFIVETALNGAFAANIVSKSTLDYFDLVLTKFTT